MTPPTPLPPGTCLTDHWPFLNATQRRAWLQVVEREARAVHLEVERARQLRADRGLNATVINAVLRPGDTPAARQRRRVLEDALEGYRIGDPPATTTVRGPPRRAGRTPPDSATSRE